MPFSDADWVPTFDRPIFPDAVFTVNGNTYTSAQIREVWARD